jgi:hypothetical protein
VSYPEGQELKFSAAFTNGSVGADPVTVTFEYKPPDEDPVLLTYGIDAEINRVGAGAYYVEIVAEPGGLWLYRWEGSGNDVNTAVEGAVAIQEARI